MEDPCNFFFFFFLQKHQAQNKTPATVEICMSSPRMVVFKLFGAILEANRRHMKLLKKIKACVFY